MRSSEKIRDNVKVVATLLLLMAVAAGIDRSIDWVLGNNDGFVVLHHHIV